MAEITASAVGRLREMTSAGLMDCKKALTESNGNLDLAIELLRKRGVAQAAVKAGREAREGVMTQYIAAGSRIGVLVEINCETDFVAKNDTFRAFCDEVARTLAAGSGADLEPLRIQAVSTIGENIRIARHQRFELGGPGLIAAYIHTGGKVGVLAEVGCTREVTTARDEFKQLVRDITLQIAAASPLAVSRESVPPELAAKEREIASESDLVKGKPAQAVEKIVAGKMEKFFQTVVLLEQGFVKNPELSVSAHVSAMAKVLGDEPVIRRFVRWQVGEVATA